MTTTTVSPVYLRQGKGETYYVLGATVSFLATSQDTAGVSTLLEYVSPPGQGIARLVLHREDVIFYILDGEFTFHVGDQVFEARAGDRVYAPRGIPHAATNTQTTPSAILAFVTPAGVEGFLREVGQPRMEGKAPPDVPALLSIAARYGVEFVPPDTMAFPGR